MVEFVVTRVVQSLFVYQPWNTLPSTGVATAVYVVAPSSFCSMA